MRKALTIGTAITFVAATAMWLATSVSARGGGTVEVEVKYNGPDGVMVDVSETGWVGTSGFNV